VTIVTAHLYVCETCVRDRPVSAGERTLGRQLADAITERLRTLSSASAAVHRVVMCLNGCPRPCNVAMRGARKHGFRLGRLTPDDAPDIVDLFLAYAASPDGDIPPERWPAHLRDKVTMRTPPLGGDPAG
jgi:predicted metal-binding protein